MKIKIMVFVITLVMLMPIFMIQSLRAQNLIVRIDPATQTAESSQIISVDVFIENVSNLGAFQFDMVYDTNVLHANSATMGAFLSSTGRTVIPVGPDVDNSTNPGKVTFGGATLGVNAGPIGSGTLASVEFATQANGGATLELQNVQVSDINGQAMTINTISNGDVIIGSGTGEGMVVTNTNNSGEGSLRWVIEQANMTPESNEITFAIPISDPGYEADIGIWRIKPATELPALEDMGMSIDGWSQENVAGDINPDGPEIVLDGSLTEGRKSGLLVAADDISIYGMNIQHFQNAGILVSGASGTIISECLIGTDHRGETAAGNYDGIVLTVGASETLVGSEEDSLGNVISGNTRFGVFITGSSHNQVMNNLIGINQAETDTIGNHAAGVSMQDGSNGNQVMYNFIGGNLDGVTMINADSTEVIGNWIGTDSSFTQLFGNRAAGVYFWSFSRYTNVLENVIGYNLAEGVSVGSENALHNHISENAISHNGGMGISNWSGGNMELMAPTIVSISELSIQGTAQPGQIVEVFADESDEGRLFIGSDEADDAGSFSVDLEELPPFSYITATATDESGNTSGFSTPFVITEVADHSQRNTALRFELGQNYPNPFNPVTFINYTVPPQLKNRTHIMLQIFNLRGQIVKTLVNDTKSSGDYMIQWNGKNDSGGNVPSGIYLYLLQVGEFKTTRKMTLMK
ncbi:right-handed parallel beta-helix repeat-containing protein [candidate division KSB1 bacterium]|nr:right-handed parallel beta-helix repeat-containing protein [candidate division KSB1 bacterium]